MRYMTLVLAVFAGMFLGGLGLTYQSAIAKTERTTYQELNLFMDVLTRV